MLGRSIQIPAYLLSQSISSSSTTSSRNTVDIHNSILVSVVGAFRLNTLHCWSMRNNCSLYKPVSIEDRTKRHITITTTVPCIVTVRYLYSFRQKTFPSFLLFLLAYHYYQLPFIGFSLIFISWIYIFLTMLKPSSWKTVFC